MNDGVEQVKLEESEIWDTSMKYADEEDVDGPF